MLIPWRFVLHVGFDVANFDLGNDTCKLVFDLVNDGAEALAFWAKVVFVDRLFTPLEIARSWGTGCSCHEDDRLKGKPVKCDLVGRRATGAWDQVLSTVQVLRASANSLVEEDSVIIKANLFDSFMASSRALQGIIILRWRHLDGLPYKICRSRSPEIMRQCLRQAAKMGTLDDVSAKFFCPQSRLFADCVRLANSPQCSDQLYRRERHREHQFSYHSLVGEC